MGPDTLNFTNSFKFLGVTIDRKLSFSDHIASVKGKVAKFAGILYKIRDQLPVEVRVRFYYSFVYPHLSYNIAVWGSTHANLLNPLYLLQKRVVRNIAGESYLTHTGPLFKKFSLLKLKDIFTYHICIYMYKSMKDDSFAVPHNVNTRNRDLAHPTRHRLTMCQQAVSYTGPSEWNKLPGSLRSSDSLELFKRDLKVFLVSSY